MEMMHAGLLLLLFCSACSYQYSSGTGLGLQDPEAEWDRVAKIMGEETTAAAAVPMWRSATGPESLKANRFNFPPYMRVSMSKYSKQAFKPERGVRPLPGFAKEIVMVPSSTRTAAETPASKPLIEALCHLDRIYARIRRVFKSVNAYKSMSLGACAINAGTKEHYYFLYNLTTDCTYKKESLPDFLSYSNVISFNPSGPVIRDWPFVVRLQCKYHRLFHSFKVGFYPKLQGGTVFKGLTATKQKVVLVAQDASGNVLTGSKTYTLGQPMFFEAKMADATANTGARMYLNKCFMTADPSPNSNPKYTIIENQGCMIDSTQAPQSKYLSSISKTSQKFQVVAFVFRGSTSSFLQQLYMHCEVTMGASTPSPIYKACTYDSVTKKWKELYGPDAVCTCCETTCPALQPRASKTTISSASWKVNLSDQDGHVNVEPRMKSTDADSLSLEDSDMAVQADFLNYWEDDY